MPATPKKSAKAAQAPAPRLPIVAPRPLDPESMVQSLSKLALELSALAAPGQLLSQRALEIARAMRAINGVTDAALKLFDATVVPWGSRLAEAYEPGTLAIQIENRPSARPKWKEEAVSQAAKVAEMSSLPFVEEVYVKRVQDATPKTDSKSVRIVEVGV